MHTLGPSKQRAWPLNSALAFIMKRFEVEPESQISHELFLMEMPSKKYVNILVAKFSGEYGYGSGGNIDAEYMYATLISALSFSGASGVILDFTELSYQWGDKMGLVLSAPADRDLPLVVVGSELCEKSLKSLIEDELLIEDQNMLFKDIESAVIQVDSEYQQQC